jgi:hypothetical protein
MIAIKRRKTGRPRIEERAKTLRALAPWKAAGMSRATWFRRQAERRAEASEERISGDRKDSGGAG